MMSEKRIKCRKPMAHRPEFEGKHHCSQCELELQNELCKCSNPLPHHVGVHPQSCRKCGGIVE